MANQLVFNQTLTVPESAGDVPTGAFLRDGDYFEISADGSIWAGVWLTSTNGPQGWNNIAMEHKFPDPSAHAYSLLGKVDSDYFEVGTGIRQLYRRQAAQGATDTELVLRVNDDAPGNGSGAFTALILVWRPPAETVSNALEQEEAVAAQGPYDVEAILAVLAAAIVRRQLHFPFPPPGPRLPAPRPIDPLPWF